MDYIDLGNSGVKISRLSMGCGRLPEDDEASTALIHAVIDAGINYFETATFYCDNRCLEKTGLGIKGRRDEVMVQVKIGTESDSTADSVRREMESQFQRMDIDRADFYMFGWLTWERMPVVLRRGGVLEGVRRLQDEGAVKHLGFTGHDSPENFIKILETGLFESMTVSYNLLNRNYEKTIARAHELGVGVIVMNPVGGGRLSVPSETLRKKLPGRAKTTSEAALQFVLSNPGVSTACSGMSNLAQLEENLCTVEKAKETDETDFAAANAILDELKGLGDRFCTGCKYCMPCPQGVDIPENFTIYNNHTVYDLKETAEKAYEALAPECRADRCTQCGECEEKCPQDLDVVERLAMVADLFGT